MHHRGALLLLCAGCGAPASTEIVGPFTGTAHRFVVDRIDLPKATTPFAADVNGDGRVDNQLDNLVAAIADVTSVGEDPAAAAVAQVRAGTVAPVVELTSDDDRLQQDPSVGVSWSDAGQTGQLGGALVGGGLVTNRALTTGHPALLRVRIPVAGAADPVAVEVVAAEVTLRIDGNGGYSGELHGALRRDDARGETWRVLRQIIYANPADHPAALMLFDPNRDGQLTDEELAQNQLLNNILTPDLDLFDAKGNWKPVAEPRSPGADSLSIGLGFHLVPCATGRCAPAVAPSCIDRQSNGDESGVDCGGATCRKCEAAQACRAPTDCQSARCTAGRCDP